MKKRVFAAALCAGMLFAVPACAKGLVAEGVYDADTELLEIGGTAAAGGGGIAAVILPYGKDRTTVVPADVNNQEAAFSMVHLGDGGSFSLEMGLPPQWKSGLYKAVLNQGADVTEVWFTYADGAQLQQALAQVNQADSAGKVAEALEANAAALGAEAEHLARYRSGIGQYLYQTRPTGGYTAGQLLESYTAALALAQVQGGQETLSETLGRFASYIDLDLEKDYLNYSAAIQQETERLFAKLNAGDMQTGEFYRQCLLLARINKAETDEVLQALVLNNAETLGISLTNYNRLSSDYTKLKVFGKMRTGGYESYAQVKTAFDSACTQLKDTGSNGNSGGGSSGGYGGGYSGGSGSGGYGGYGGGNGGLGDGLGNKPETTVDELVESFTDMDGHWAQAPVTALAAKGVVNGFPDGSFLPEQKVTRAEFSKMVCLIMELSGGAYQDIFADVGRDDWFTPYVLTLADTGIVTGYDGAFHPDDRISRQDAAVMTQRALRFRGIQLAGTAAFEDEADIADYAKDAVLTLANAGIISGFEGRFLPLDETTRAEAAALLYRVADSYKLGK